MNWAFSLLPLMRTYSYKINLNLKLKISTTTQVKVFWKNVLSLLPWLQLIDLCETEKIIVVSICEPKWTVLSWIFQKLDFWQKLEKSLVLAMCNFGSFWFMIVHFMCSHVLRVIKTSRFEIRCRTVRKTHLWEKRIQSFEAARLKLWNIKLSLMGNNLLWNQK